MNGVSRNDIAVIIWDRLASGSLRVSRSEAEDIVDEIMSVAENAQHAVELAYGVTGIDPA